MWMRRLFKNVYCWLKSLFKRKNMYQKEDVLELTKLLGNRFSFILSDSYEEISYKHHGEYSIDFKIIYSKGGNIDYYIYLNKSKNEVDEFVMIEDLENELKYISYSLNKKKSQIIEEFKSILRNNKQDARI
jgi:hypothetical protein